MTDASSTPILATVTRPVERTATFSGRAVRLAALGLVSLGLVSALGCDAPVPRRAVPAPLPRGAHVEELPSSVVPDPPPPAIADAPPASRRPLDPSDAARAVSRRATSRDESEDRDEVIPAQRCVYRVEFVVPESLGPRHPSLRPLSAELFVDVSADRLRARFVGTGWPVDPDAEVRLRADRPGVYLFDSQGGRPLSPGALSAWFAGGPVPGGAVSVSVRRDVARRHVPAPGGLVCALVAEWSGQPREAVVRRCEGTTPWTFRVGAWRAERTADVPVELPRRALRADEVAPPHRGAEPARRNFLEATAVARIAPAPSPGRPVVGGAADGGVAEGLAFSNESGARVIVAAEGVPLGWVDAHEERRFSGLVPARYRVAALFPLGGVAMRSRLVPIPGRVVFQAATETRREAR